jgi:hypothetical protein
MEFSELRLTACARSARSTPRGHRLSPDRCFESRVLRRGAARVRCQRASTAAPARNLASAPPQAHLLGLVRRCLPPNAREQRRSSRCGRARHPPHSRSARLLWSPWITLPDHCFVPSDDTSGSAYSPNLVEGEFSDVRIQDGAYPQSPVILALHHVALIPSDRPQHLALQDKVTSQRIQTE